GVDHIVGLRVRVVPERAYRTWGEHGGELILLAMDETGWLSLVGLNNRGFLAGADRGRPRVDWRDLEAYSDGLIALTGMPGGGGMLSAAIEHSANPAEPIEALGLTRRPDGAVSEPVVPGARLPWELGRKTGQSR